ncbi:MAG: SPFH domain-containing protein [Ruminococcus sp.]|nr:SPFH domain-containing protein [Ruminococcus sp.]
MGLIKLAVESVKGMLADSIGEVIEPAPMGESVCMVPGQLITHNGRSQNTGFDNTVSNGSIIHVYDKQMMFLMDGGKIVDFTAEPGYFKVDNSSTPSLLWGQFGDTVKGSFDYFRYGGITPHKQRVVFLNLQEMKAIPFGTPNAVQYFDNFYNAELFIRAHGTYSIQITDPFKFYQQVIPKDAVTEGKIVDFKAIRTQYNDEFIEGLAAAINQYSADGNRVSHITAKTPQISAYMKDALDETWDQLRGMEIVSVGVKVSYDEESQALINMRNKGAMLSDAAVQQGYVAANISEGLKAAGSNENGAMAGFMGMGFGMNAGGNILGGYQQNPHYRPTPGTDNQQMQNQQQMQQPQQQQQQQAQTPAPAPTPTPAPAANGSWTCSCGAVNTGKFCPECGSKKPEAPKKRFCTNCGYELNATSKFCPECGTKAGE